MKGLLFVGLGALAGGLLGYFQQCAGGTCPLLCVWWRGALFGALAGLVLWLAGRPPAKPTKSHADDVQDK
jgi:hypothetical protein